EAERRDDEALADRLVVDRREPAEEARRIAPRALERGGVFRARRHRVQARSRRRRARRRHLRLPRYATSASMSDDDSAVAGMFTPGLKSCGLAIQRASSAGRFGSVPAA